MGSPEQAGEFKPGHLLFFRKGVVHAVPEITELPVVFLSVDTPRLCDRRADRSGHGQPHRGRRPAAGLLCDRVLKADFIWDHGITSPFRGGFFPTWISALRLHGSLRQEMLQPMDMVAAIDKIGVADKRAE
jgi:hypothetical protein